MPAFSARRRRRLRGRGQPRGTRPRWRELRRTGRSERFLLLLARRYPLARRPAAQPDGRRVSNQASTERGARQRLPAGKDPVVDEVNRTHPALVTYLLDGRRNREKVQRGVRVHKTDPRRVSHPGEVPPVGHLRQGDEPDAEVGERDTQPLRVDRRAQQLVEEGVLGVLGGEGVTRAGILAGEDRSGEVGRRRVGDRMPASERGREVRVPGAGAAPCRARQGARR